jgi:hypothetical protein
MAPTDLKPPVTVWIPMIEAVAGSVTLEHAVDFIVMIWLETEDVGAVTVVMELVQMKEGATVGEEGLQ